MNPRNVTTVPEAGLEASSEQPSRLGHFDIVGRLGAGGMGLVFEGRDAMLGRRVALKLLHPSRAAGPGAPARLLREAQALARLSHPNVVTVYEVGVAGTEWFVAMELVEGTTLREWMAAPRDWRAALDLFLAVGHGLAAVHGHGLVHRDFKPSNVLVDRRGVPKLGDFGLVAASEPDEPSPPPPPGNSDLTAPGSVLGTPAYMAPEQRRGEAVDARADQYSFAKTLREALRAPMPAALEPILARALADAPADRFPAMAPLLAALARVRRGNRRRWLGAALAGGLVAAVAIAWGVGRSNAERDEPCPRPLARLGAVWSPVRRSVLEAHLAAIDPALGRQRFAAAALALDRGAERWQDVHVEACRLTQQGRQSDALLDRRMACLDRALRELDDTVSVLEHAADRVKLDEAMGVVLGLPTLESCADVAGLAEALPRPTNPLQRAQADAITRDDVDLDVALRSTGTRAGVIERAGALVARARQLGHPDTLAVALRVLAVAQLEDEAGAATVDTLREAITAAATAHDDRGVAELWSKLLTALVLQNRGRDAATLVPAAEAAVARAGAALEPRVALLDAEAQVAALDGEIARAQQLLDDARATLERAGAASSGSPLAPLLLAIRTRSAATRGAARDWPGMASEYRVVVALTDAQYGHDHPAVMNAHFNLGIALRYLRDDDAALVEFREATRIGQARLAPSPSLVMLLVGVGSTLAQLGRADDALGYLERALAMARATMPADDARLAKVLSALATTLLEKQRYPEAQHAFEDAVAIYERLDRRGSPDWAVAQYDLGLIALQTAHCERALAPLERAVAAYRALADRDPYDLHITLNVLGECQLTLGRWTSARSNAELVLAASAVDPAVRAMARFIHGRARAGGGDAPGGLAEVRDVRAAVTRLAPAADPDNPAAPRLRDIDGWLAHH